MKVWIYKGEIIPERGLPAIEVEEPEPAPVAPAPRAESEGPAHTAISMEQQAAARSDGGSN